MTKNPSFTKQGPGRKPKQGSGNREHTRTFAGLLMKVWADKRAQKLLRKSTGTLRDQHGAFTLTGRPRGYGVLDTSEREHTGRRIWLGGISAQRGF